MSHNYSASFLLHCTGASALTGFPINNNTVSWPFIFTDIRCNGSESKLVDCLHGSHIADCSLAETVYVHCQSCKYSQPYE